MRALASLALLLVAATACANCKSNKKSAESKEPPTAPRTHDGAPMAPAAPAPKAKTPATAAEFSAMLRELVGQTDPATEKALEAQLVLADPDSWFEQTFGSVNGKALADAYRREKQLMRGLAQGIRFHQSQKKRVKVVAEKFDSADDPAATGLQARAMAAMAVPVSLFSVRYSKPSGAGVLHYYNFIHDGERFRYVGPLLEFGNAPTGATLETLGRRQRDVGRKP